MDNLNITAPDFSGGPLKFLKQVRSELKKVIWPTKKEVIKLTGVVILISFIVGVYIGVLDYIFAKLMETIIKT